MNVPAKITTGRMTSKGQVLLSKPVREAIGLKPNARYSVFVNEQNQAVIAPVPIIGDGPEFAEERVRRMREGLLLLAGTGTGKQTTDEIMRELRGDWEP